MVNFRKTGIFNFLVVGETEIKLEPALCGQGCLDVEGYQ
jgi:hypothetical protein